MIRFSFMNLARLAEFAATAPHAFVERTQGPGWLCAVCGKGRDDAAHAEEAP